jgi:hypothetical protein
LQLSYNVTQKEKVGKGGRGLSTYVDSQDIINRHSGSLSWRGAGFGWNSERPFTTTKVLLIFGQTAKNWVDWMLLEKIKSLTSGTKEKVSI